MSTDKASTNPASPDHAERWAALALLARCAAPDAPLLRSAVLWLVLAVGLEPLGPVLGKAFIDHYLLPRHADRGAIAGLLGGALLAGWVASLLRYRQLVQLAGGPKILLLDEATAHIDSETEGRVQRALTALHGRVTVLAIAQRLSTIREADQIIVLNHGRIAERGSHSTLMAIEGGLYQRLVKVQQLQEDEDADDLGPGAANG